MERPIGVSRKERKIQGAVPLVRDAVGSLEQGQSAGAFAVMTETRRLGRERGQRVSRGTVFKAMGRLQESGEFNFNRNNQ